MLWGAWAGAAMQPRVWVPAIGDVSSAGCKVAGLEVQIMLCEVQHQSIGASACIRLGSDMQPVQACTKPHRMHTVRLHRELHMKHAAAGPEGCNYGAGCLIEPGVRSGWQPVCTGMLCSGGP